MIWRESGRKGKSDFVRMLMSFNKNECALLQVMKTRLALRRTGEYDGMFDCAKKLFRSEGLRVFYRGYLPNLLGILPYAGIDLTVYETLKRKYLLEYNQNGGSPPAISLLTFGTFSSCCGQVAAYPLALVRTKLQSQGTAYFLHSLINDAQLHTTT